MLKEEEQTREMEAGGWGGEGSLAFGESEIENPRKETRKRNEKDQSGRLRGRQGGVDKEGSSHRV